MQPEEPAPNSLERHNQYVRKQRFVYGSLGLLGVLLVGGLGLGVYMAVRADNQGKQRAAHAAYAAATDCLLGSDGWDRSSPSRRFRALQLGALGAIREGVDANSNVTEKWPTRCVVPLRKLSGALTAAGMASPDKHDVAHYGKQLEKAVEQPDAVYAPLGELIDGLYAAGVEAKLSDSKPSQTAPSSTVPAAVVPLSVSDLAESRIAKGHLPVTALASEPHASTTLRLLVSDRTVAGAPFLCTLRASSDHLECRALPGALGQTKHGLRLFATADDGREPLVYAGVRGEEGIFESETGSRIDALYTYGGHVDGKGNVVVVGENRARGRLVLVQKPVGQPSRAHELKLDFYAGNWHYNIQLAFDELLARGVRKREIGLFSLPVHATEPPPEKFQDHGTLQEQGAIEGGEDEAPHLLVCKSGDTSVLRIKGYYRDSMSFRIQGKWTAPVLIGFTSGRLSCRSGEGTVTRLEYAGPSAPYKTTVSQSRCSSAGCKPTRVSMEAMLKDRLPLEPRAGVVDAIDHVGKLLLVWAAGERGGLRARLSPVETLAQAPDQVLLDDLIVDGKVGKEPQLLGVRAFANGDRTILAVQTVSGTFALKMDASGAIAPLTVRWKEPR